MMIDESLIKTWEEMSQEMKTAFLPYKQQLYKRWFSLRKASMTSQQYKEEFYNFDTQNDVSDSQETLTI